MKFKFYPVESRIYDFLKFPDLVNLRERYEKSKEEDDYKAPFFTDYMDFINRVEKRLKPYIKEIELFYKNKFLEDDDFIGLISNVYSIFGYSSENEYLDMLLGLNEREINRSIAYSIISGNESIHEYSEELISRAESLSLNKGELISLIKDWPVDASSKWTMFLIIEEPVKYMKMYAELMQKIQPIFKEFYGLYEEEVNRYGQYLADFLNKNGSKGLEEITYSTLDSKVLNNGENRILISAVMQFAVTISGTGEHNYIAWGLMMEEAFRRMKEINENKINERVKIFKNLGDRTRYEVVRLIASGITSTKEIAEALGVSSATISYHINNLLQSKIIKIDRKDNKYGYVIDYNLIEEIINGLKEDLKAPGN